MFLASLRSTAASSSLFFFLTLTFMLLMIGNFINSVKTIKAGGAFGILTAAIAYYVAASGVINGNTSCVISLCLFFLLFLSLAWPWYLGQLWSPEGCSRHRTPWLGNGPGSCVVFLSFGEQFCSWRPGGRSWCLARPRATLRLARWLAFSVHRSLAPSFIHFILILPSLGSPCHARGVHFIILVCAFLRYACFLMRRLRHCHHLRPAHPLFA